MKININANNIGNVISGDIINLHENFIATSNAIEKSVLNNSTSKEVELLIAGDYQTLFSQLKDKHQHDNILLNQIILLSTRYNRLSQNRGIGVLSYEEQEREYAKISEALLVMVKP